MLSIKAKNKKFLIDIDALISVELNYDELIAHFCPPTNHVIYMEFETEQQAEKTFKIIEKAKIASKKNKQNPK